MLYALFTHRTVHTRAGCTQKTANLGIKYWLLDPSEDKVSCRLWLKSCGLVLCLISPKLNKKWWHPFDISLRIRLVWRGQWWMWADMHQQEGWPSLQLRDWNAATWQEKLPKWVLHAHVCKHHKSTDQEVLRSFFFFAWITCSLPLFHPLSSSSFSSPSCELQLQPDRCNVPAELRPCDHYVVGLCKSSHLITAAE